MEDSTNIDDLPNSAFGGGGGGGGIVQPTAASVPPPLPPQQQQNQNQSSQVVDPKYMNYIITGIQQTGGSTLGTLPSRDIPMNTLEIQQDEHIRANYIPPPSKSSFTNDYVNEYERRHRSEKAATTSSRGGGATAPLFEDFYFPILAAILFFIFQMPIFSHMMFKYFKFLHNTDGNLTNIGVLFKSIVFGAILSAGIYIANPKII